LKENHKLVSQKSAFDARGSGTAGSEKTIEELIEIATCLGSEISVT
jgi:hypothetical protein